MNRAENFKKIYQIKYRINLKKVDMLANSFIARVKRLTMAVTRLIN